MAITQLKIFIIFYILYIYYEIVWNYMIYDCLLETTHEILE